MIWSAERMMKLVFYMWYRNYSHIFAYSVICLSVYLVYKYGLDNISYLGQEVPILIISGFLILLLMDELETVFSTSSTATLISIVVFLVVMVIIYSYNSWRKNSFLSTTTKIVTAEIISIKSKPFISTAKSINYAVNHRPVYVYYKYIVKGRTYYQANMYHTKILKNIKLVNKIINIRYSVKKPQVSEILRKNVTTQRN